MLKRKCFSKKLKFEVFKRDSFTCQYCGEKAPDVSLVIDHIHPVSKGGKNDILNLITSCVDCNTGKSNILLSDSTVLDKKHKQLKEFQDRKEQIEMMFRWQESLLKLNDATITKLSKYWLKHTRCSLTNNGLRTLRKLVKKFEISEIMAAIKISTEQYLRYQNDKIIEESAEIAFKKIGGICYYNQKPEDEKGLFKKLFYIRGILKNRLNGRYFDGIFALQLLKKALNNNVNLDWIADYTKTVHSWSAWKNTMCKIIEEEGVVSSQKDS